jgi:parvulin-like peptidyl-prolyl isomerase
MHQHLPPRLLLLPLALGLPACDPPADERLAAPPAPATEAPPPAEADAAQVELPPPPAAAPAGLPAGAPDRILARHLLITYDGALGAPATQRRTQAEALAKATDLHQKLLAGADFAGLAKASSDDGSGPKGGALGVVTPGMMTPAFEQAAFALAEGQLSGVVETPFGYHIIRRDPLVEVQLSQVLVQWAGLPRSSAKRSKDEARAQAEQARARLAGGEPVAAVVNALSDGPMKERGGDLGHFQKGTLQPALEGPAFALPVGGVSAVVETAHGFHVLVRTR